MAVYSKSSKMVDLIKPGITPNASDRGVSWIQNMQKEEGSWAVRPGFGTVARLDTSMTTGKEQVGGFPVGLQRHLGSYLIKDTGFGHKQMVSIFRAQVYTTDFLKSDEVEATLWQRQNQYRTIYTAFVYDLTTDERFEVPLAQHTSQMGAELADRHGVYETVRGEKFEADYQLWIDAGQNEQGPNREFNTDRDEFFWFAEQKDAATRVMLLFGNSRAGAWFYTPIDPRFSEKSWRQRQMSVNGAYTQDFRDPYSETSCIQPLFVRDGVFAPDGTTYMTQGDFGKPQAACALDRRMVYAVDNLLMFSDPEDLNAIVDTNIQGFSSKIIAVAPTLGNLIVWTEDNQTHYYNPTQGDIISGGRIVTMTKDVGIVGPNAWTNINGAIVWVDKSGIYRNYGNTSAQNISKSLQLFFEGGMSNPLLHYYTSSGASLGTDPQPHTFYEWNDSAQVGVNLNYEPTTGQLFISIPELLLSFVLEDGGYHIWNFESIVADVYDAATETYIPDVKGVQNLPKPWLLADTNEVYMVTDVTETAITDATVLDGTPTGYNTAETSFAILRLGRGGGLDGSILTEIEDRRTVNGEWVDNGLNENVHIGIRDRGWYLINKPIKITADYNFSWASVVVNNENSPMWIPIEIVPFSSDVVLAPTLIPNNYADLYLEFTFDNTQWAPYINAGATTNYEPVYDLPSERLGAVDSYFLGTADEPTNVGVRVYNSSTGLGDPAGDTIRMRINGVVGTWATSPDFGFIPKFKNPLLLLAFYRKTSPVTDCYSPGFNAVTATATDGFAATTNMAVRVWDGQVWGLSIANGENTVQSVDWMYTAEEIHSEDAGFMLKARGINIDAESSSTAILQANNPGVLSSWPIRLLNIITSTNYKQYAAQLLDFQTDPKSLIKVEKNEVRNRIGTSAAQTAPVFAGTPAWGDFTDSTAGNLLIGDAQYDNLKTSVGVKGDRIVVQLFGHILSPAEKLRIGMMKLFLRITSGLRRKGR